MVKITLNSESARLKLSIGKNSWTTVVLDCDGESTTLGADVLNIITSRLIAALEDPQKLELSKGLKEVDAAWVLSLSECHCSIYITQIDAGVRLHVQNGDGIVFSSFFLSEAEVSLWKERLSQLELLDQPGVRMKN